MAEKANAANVSHPGWQRDRDGRPVQNKAVFSLWAYGHLGFQIKKEGARPDWCEHACGENRTPYVQAEVSRNM